MAKSKEDDGASGDREGEARKAGLDKEIDDLYRLPLAAFTAARNVLSSRLKKAGLGEEAAQVKALAKPSIPAWVVNQLYWRHPDAFRKLTAAGEELGRAQASQFAGGDAGMRGALAARREALSNLSRLAQASLRDAGHSPTPDTMRRITTTLEALSTASQQSGKPLPGRLTEDLGPPGFESLAALMPEGLPKVPAAAPRLARSQPGQKRRAGRRHGKDAEIARAQHALEAAERALREARAAAKQRLAAQKKAAARLEQAEENRREAAARLERASLAEEEARGRLRRATAEADEAATTLGETERRAADARRSIHEQSRRS